MEDTLNDQLAPTAMSVPIKNGEVSSLQESDISSDKELDNEIKSVKVNGDTKPEESDGVDSSDCDNLVIDERPQNNRKRKILSPKDGFKGFKKLKGENEYEPPTNPYFNESLFELTELHHNKNIHSSDKTNTNDDERNEKTCINDVAQIGEEASNSSVIATTQTKKLLGKKNKKNGSPKLREYAQYLGLQPTVQFKCSRCAQSGFTSLPSLNEHHKQCRAKGPISSSRSTTFTASPSTNFRVTRKVFLCSACGTYYENWNLFLHMREVHKRFICLYCLGMFSLPDKLSLHLVSKHSCVPSQLNSEEDFFQLYKEPCFLMCCDCEKVFCERDNFFDHLCVGKPNKSTTETKNKTTTNTNRHTAIQKSVANKTIKPKSKTFVEHVTGDTPDIPVAPNENQVEEATNPENNCDNINTNENNSEENKEADPSTENEPQENVETNSVSPLQNSIENPPEIQAQPDETATNLMDTMETNDDVKNNETELSNNVSTDTVESNNSQDKEVESDIELEETPSPANCDEEMQSELMPDMEFTNELSSKEEDEEENIKSNDSEQEDTRRVPKVTLKLPKSITTNYAEHEDSDDSDKLTMELDSVEGETDFLNNISDEKENKEPSNISEPSFMVAGSEIPITELELEQPLDKFDIQVLLQKCLKATVPTCVYCNHARKIAVNGKQLGLHAIAEHRFSAVVNSITAEELIPESFVARITEGLPELQDVYFNLESAVPEEGLTFSHVFECFQCRYATTVHKELYLHNRKMHAKTILLCIMCKSNFYSYSELICHLCPGLYELNSDVNFRCCMCVSDDLPSAFRLMVHLRKRHHACDVCLELCHNQSRLSNHVWKHKLHHLCYRCGIAYRNKPDITKHLFWKHGTESVLCKRCLQKKWPHVYHFCIPPNSFTCEECNLNFTKAVSLKVHKRIHTDEKPHVCTFESCMEKFISKKLLLKHEFKHREPPEDALQKGPEPVVSENVETQQTTNTNIEEKQNEDFQNNEPVDEPEKPKIKPKVDVYDLPELNLSESDSSDSEDEAPKTEKKEDVKPLDENTSDLNILTGVKNENSKDENVSEDIKASTDIFNVEQPAPVLENIWDDFKNYQASKEKLGNFGTGMDVVEPEEATATASQESGENQKFLVEVIMRDHDYSVLSQDYKSDVQPEQIERTQSMDHDYCSPTTQNEQTQQQQPQEFQKPQSPPAQSDKKVAKDSSSSDSSDSDSSSCTSNCSCCSASSDSSSSSSDSSDSDSSSSEGRRRQQARREKKKLRAKNKNKESENSPIDVVATDNQPSVQLEQLIQESDLDTSETETDEDFYDKQPQKLANKLIAEKRKELLSMAGIGPLINGSVLESSRPSTPSLPETEEVKPRKKSKSKKKKKKSKRQEEKPSLTLDIPSSSYQYQPSTVSPLTISLPKNSPLTTPVPVHSIPAVSTNSTGLFDEEQAFDASNISDSSLRASKRRRIPNKFYGYSSDEEHERHQPPVFKWRKADLPSPARPAPSSPLVVPPITIKAVPPVAITEDPLPTRPVINMNELRIQQTGTMPPPFQRPQPLIASRVQEQESGSESNDSSSEEEQQPPPIINKPNQPPLYCYCRCPYDEVSEMIGCDANDCAIEWFHFECVGIMVPPKGQWFCPDCRKKKQQRKELSQT